MSKYRILIVDDDEDVRRLVGMALRPRYEVVEACDGLDALTRLETLEPDFAIIDVMMPMMDGYQVCEAIRRHPRFKNMQVMFLSAYGTKENIKRGYATGANLFLTKPVDPARILKNIDFTIQHEPPSIRPRKYTLADLERMELVRHQGSGLDAEGDEAPPEEVQDEWGHAIPPSMRRDEPPSHSAPTARQPDAYSGPGVTSETQGRVVPEAKPRVLMVDDDEEALKMLDLALRDIYEVTTANDGMEAVERLVEYQPDLMLIDIMMPKMNGYQLLQSVRRNHYFSNLPVIVLSAKSTPRDQEYAARLGATLFLAKPYKIDDLLSALAAITNAPGFKIHSKKITMFEIKQRVYAQTREREEREQEYARRRQYGAIKEVIKEGQKPEKPK